MKCACKEIALFASAQTKRLLFPLPAQFAKWLTKRGFKHTHTHLLIDLSALMGFRAQPGMQSISMSWLAVCSPVTPCIAAVSIL